MYKYIRKAIEKHALAEYPREACGLIVALDRRHSYIPCTNQAEHDQDFKISAQDYADAEDRGEVLAIVHSHIDRSAMPTDLDKRSCEATGLPWHIVSVLNDMGETYIGGWHSFEPSGYRLPLIGRQFHHGTIDCYGVIRDFYDYELGIHLIDLPREDKWWDKPDAKELYLDQYHLVGFSDVTDGSLQYGDVILMQYNSNMTNHGGVYLGDAVLKTDPDLHPIPNAMLHHPQPRLSERVVYGGMWRDQTRKIIRHESQWKR